MPYRVLLHFVSSGVSSYGADPLHSSCCDSARQHAFDDLSV